MEQQDQGSQPPEAAGDAGSAEGAAPSTEQGGERAAPVWMQDEADASAERTTAAKAPAKKARATRAKKAEAPAAADQPATTEPPAVTRSQNVIHILPQDWSMIGQALAPALERVDTSAASTQVLVLTGDPTAALAVADAALLVREETALMPVTSVRRASRLAAEQAPLAVAGTPADIAQLISSSTLKLDALKTLVVAWLDAALVTGDMDTALETIMAEVPKGAARVVIAAASSDPLDAFVERYMRRARRVDAPSPAGEPLSRPVQFLTAAADGRAATLRRLLDEIDPASAVIVTRTDEGTAEARQLLRTLGYGSRDTVRVVQGDDDAADAGLIVLYELPESREALRAVVDGTRGTLVLMLQPRQLVTLRRMVGSTPVTPFALPDGARRARDRQERLVAELRERVAHERHDRELLALEPLVSEFDGVEIAATLLRMVDEARAAAGVTADAAAREVSLAREARATWSAMPTPPLAQRISAAPADAHAPESRQERAPADRPREERPRDERPRDDRPRTERPREERAREERPREERAPTARATESFAKRPAPPEKHSGAWTRLFINVGERDGATPGDIVGAITGESGLTRDVVGKIDLRDSHAIVEVEGSVAEQIIQALGGANMRGRSISARVDAGPPVGSDRGRGSSDRGGRGGSDRGGSRGFDRGDRGGRGGSSDRGSRSSGERSRVGHFSGARPDREDRPSGGDRGPRSFDRGDRPPRSGGFERGGSSGGARTGGFDRSSGPRTGGFDRSSGPRTGGFDRSSGPRTGGFDRSSGPRSGAADRGGRSDRPDRGGAAGRTGGARGGSGGSGQRSGPGGGDRPFRGGARDSGYGRTLPDEQREWTQRGDAMRAARRPPGGGNRGRGGDAGE